jgi:Tfp pilus assembly protein PilN
MAGIDLIPRQYALERRLWRRCKRFAAAMLALVCFLAAARGALWLGNAHEQRQLSDLRRNEQLSAESLTKVREFEQRKMAAQKELKALDDLRGRDRVRVLVEALDRAYVDGIWFDEIRSFRTDMRPAAGGPPGAPAANPAVVHAQPAPALPGVPGPDRQRIEFAGHAVEHSRLADFMTRLAAQPGLSDVRLLDTSSSGESGERLVDFRMSLAITGGRQP